ncbi:Uncharacterised protein [Mycobacteroides abscessus subsp. abscessus]|nr:Uncharacterised protein [Mycobacteroides abscessus subsp. abscessus]
MLLVVLAHRNRHGALDNTVSGHGHRVGRVIDGRHERVAYLEAPLRATGIDVHIRVRRPELRGLPPQLLIGVPVEVPRCRLRCRDLHGGLGGLLIRHRSREHDGDRLGHTDDVAIVGRVLEQTHRQRWHITGRGRPRRRGGRHGSRHRRNLRRRRRIGCRRRGWRRQLPRQRRGRRGPRLFDTRIRRVTRIGECRNYPGTQQSCDTDTADEGAPEPTS